MLGQTNEKPNHGDREEDETRNATHFGDELSEVRQSLLKYSVFWITTKCYNGYALAYDYG